MLSERLACSKVQGKGQKMRDAQHRVGGLLKGQPGSKKLIAEGWLQNARLSVTLLIPRGQ